MWGEGGHFRRWRYTCKKISGPEKICFKNAKLQSTVSRLPHNSGKKSPKHIERRLWRRRRAVVVANLHLSLGNVLEGSCRGGQYYSRCINSNASLVVSRVVAHSLSSYYPIKRNEHRLCNSSWHWLIDSFHSLTAAFSIFNTFAIRSW